MEDVWVEIVGVFVDLVDGFDFIVLRGGSVVGDWFSVEIVGVRGVDSWVVVCEMGCGFEGWNVVGDFWKVDGGGDVLVSLECWVLVSLEGWIDVVVGVGFVLGVMWV